MKVNGVTNGVNMQAGQMAGQQEDDLISKNLKRQIEDLQKSIQEIASDTKMSGEEKMKKRQEIQKQINDLNMQLRQRQLELRREKQQEKAASLQMNTLADTNKILKEAADSESKTKAAEDAEDAEDESGAKISEDADAEEKTETEPGQVVDVRI